MKYVIIILALCVSVSAETELSIRPDSKGVTVTVSNYPVGKAIALLVKDSLDRWVMLIDEDGGFYIHYSKETNEPISWTLPANNDKAFFKAIVLTYKTERNK